MPGILNIDREKSLVTITVERMGDHCILGALTKLDLISPFSLKEFHVNLTINECVECTYLKNMEDLLKYKPNGLNITIHNFIRN